VAIENLDRFDVAFNERGMAIKNEELKKEVNSETYRCGITAVIYSCILVLYAGFMHIIHRRIRRDVYHI